MVLKEGAVVVKGIACTQVETNCVNEEDELEERRNRHRDLCSLVVAAI